MPSRRVSVGFTLAVALLSMATFTSCGSARAGEERPLILAMAREEARLVAGAGAADVEVAPGEPVRFVARAMGGAGPYLYSWRFGDGSVSRLRHPAHAYQAPGDYLAQVTILDGRGAVRSALLPIQVRDGCSGWRVAVVVGGENPRGVRADLPEPVAVPAMGAGLYQLDALSAPLRVVIDRGQGRLEEMELAAAPRAG